MLLGLVLAGLEPVWLRPDVDPATGLPAGCDARGDRGRIPPGAERRRSPGRGSVLRRDGGRRGRHGISRARPRRPARRRCGLGRPFRVLERDLRTPSTAGRRRHRDVGAQDAPQLVASRAHPGSHGHGSISPDSTAALRRPTPPAPPARSWPASTRARAPGPRRERAPWRPCYGVARGEGPTGHRGGARLLDGTRRRSVTKHTLASFLASAPMASPSSCVFLAAGLPVEMASVQIIVADRLSPTT